jgi:hypothetical protein
VRKFAVLGLLAILLVCYASSPADARRDQYEWTDVPRIVAIGDVHGAYDNLLAVLKNAKLIDDELNWIGGKAHLVQVGDVIDRGADSRKCLEFYMELQKKAKKAGGRVHNLIGNHEAFNMVGITDYITPEIFESYFDSGSKKHWESAFEIYYREHRQEAREAGKVIPPKDEVREIFLQKYPLGYFGHQVAFSKKGRYGRWIREQNLAVRLNGIVFTHGDWSEEVSALGIETLNEAVRKELSGKAPLEEGVTFHLKGPLQYRGLSEVPLTREQQEANKERVDVILANLGAVRTVVGHTVTQGVIEPRFGGKHISIDAGMLEIYEGGHQVALEIEGDTLSAIHPGGKVKLPDYLDETNFFDYLEEVAAVDKHNLTVYVKLSEEYRSRADLEAARRTLEQLFRIPKPIPFRYNQDLGDVYRDLGMREQALEQYVIYLEGLKVIIERTPDNPHLKNLLARFCLDNRLELNTAEEMIRQALGQQPNNASFLLTNGRLQIVLRQYPQAVASLEKSIESGTPGYEVYYHLGLAYLGLGDTAKARKAFELALQTDPAGDGARQELQKLGDAEDLPR